jgi:hypothetical protein
VLWYRSRLVRKQDGLLYCPDDVRGADSVTLSIANAQDASQSTHNVKVRDAGAKDRSGVPTSSMPDGILLTNLSGWWGPLDVQLRTGVSVAPNLGVMTSVAAQGRMTQPENSAQPAFSDPDITFDGSDDYLMAGSRPFIAAAANPSFWCVASFADPGGSTASTPVTLTDVGGFMTYTAAAPNRLYVSVAGNVMTVSATTTGSGDVTLTHPFTSTSLHLINVSLDSDALRLLIDGVEVASTTLTETSVAYDFAFMGAHVVGTTRGDATTITSHDGRCNEVVVSYGEVDADDTDALETYFGRNYSELSLS